VIWQPGQRPLPGHFYSKCDISGRTTERNGIVKKKIFIVGLLLFGILVFVVMFQLLWSPVFDMVVTLPEFPDKIPVYKNVKPDITIAYVATLGDKFGLTGNVTEGDEYFLVREQETGASLRVFKTTGIFRYTLTSKLYPRETPVLPSDEEAMKIATDFLAERGLLPEGVVASTVKEGGSSNGVPAHLLVIYKHAIELTGPGAGYSVRIGDRGEVVDVFINPANPSALPVHDMAALKPVKQAYQELKKTRGKFTPVNTQWVSVDSVSIAYWLDGIDKEQELIYPVYVFKGQYGQFLRIFDRDPDNYTGWVKANEESFIDIPAVEYLSTN